MDSMFTAVLTRVLKMRYWGSVEIGEFASFRLFSWNDRAVAPALILS